MIKIAYGEIDRDNIDTTSGLLRQIKDLECMSSKKLARSNPGALFKFGHHKKI